MYGCAAYVCALCACSAPDTKRGVQIPLGPEMQAVASQYTGAGNQTGKAPSATKTSGVDITLEGKRRVCAADPLDHRVRCLFFSLFLDYKLNYKIKL